MFPIVHLTMRVDNALLTANIFRLKIDMKILVMSTHTRAQTRTWDLRPIQ